MQTIGSCGQPMRDPFRVVQPPMAVLVDLVTLFPRQPHHVGSGYHAGGRQMHRVVKGRLSCWAVCEHGHCWGLVTYAITFGPKSEVEAGDASGAGVDAATIAVARNRR